MEKLLQLLKQVNSLPLEDNTDTFLNDIDSKEYHELVRLIISYADDCLIDTKGQCNWDNIDILNDNGFHIFPGERDSFGWLTGCIQTKKGIIVYG